MKHIDNSSRTEDVEELLANERLRRQALERKVEDLRKQLKQQQQQQQQHQRHHGYDDNEHQQQRQPKKSQQQLQEDLPAEKQHEEQEDPQQTGTISSQGSSSQPTQQPHAAAVKPWRKVMWERQPYKTNYVPDSFLEELVTNAHVQKPDLGSYIIQTAAVTEQISAVAMFLVAFMSLAEGSVPGGASTVVAIDLVLLVSGSLLLGLIQPALSPPSRSSSLQHARRRFHSEDEAYRSSIPQSSYEEPQHNHHHQQQHQQQEKQQQQQQQKQQHHQRQRQNQEHDDDGRAGGGAVAPTSSPPFTTITATSSLSPSPPSSSSAASPPSVPLTSPTKASVGSAFVMSTAFSSDYDKLASSSRQFTAPPPSASSLSAAAAGMAAPISTSISTPRSSSTTISAAGAARFATHSASATPSSSAATASSSSASFKSSPPAIPPPPPPPSSFGLSSKPVGASLGDTLVSLCLFLALLRVMAPVLRTLTVSYSNDTIYALTFILSVVHVAFHDYSYANAITTQFQGTVSLNAAMFVAVLLASRLETNEQVFALVLLAVELFALFPMVRPPMKRHSMMLHLSAASSGVLTACVLLALRDRTLFIVYMGTVIFVSFVCPVWLVNISRYKVQMQGPWDIAHIDESVLQM